MDFSEPRWLWLLAALPLVGLAAALAGRRRRAGWRALRQPGRPPGIGSRAWAAAMALLVLALAQPRWGRVAGGELPPGRDVVLMVDASWSMAAEDVVPNRLGRAIDAAGELVREIAAQPGDRVAVVAFAGRGAIRCPLTTNLGAVVEALRALRPGGVEPPGSDLAAGLEAAIEALGDDPRSGGRVVVILSDGEDHEPSWDRLVDRLRDLGVVVHAVAIGDRDRGHPIPVRPARPGVERPVLTLDGEPVETRRVDLELRALAMATGGAFVPIGLASADLGDLYAEHIAPVEGVAREALRRPERAERFGVFLAVGLVVGVVGSWPRRRPAERRKPWWTSWLFLMGTSTVGLIGASGDGPRTAAEAVAEGRSAFDRGAFDEALAAFERAEGLSPESPIPMYNLAATLYRLGRFDEARARYLSARERADEGLALKIDYALGNTAAALGDLPAAIGHYDDCLTSTVAGESYDRIRAFARENREFVARQAEPEAPAASTEGPDAPPSEGEGESEGEPPPGEGPGDAPDGDAPGAADPSDGPPPDVAPEPRATGAVSGSGDSSGRPSRSDSPSDRLSRAIEAIRDARDRRFPDLPDAPPPTRDRPIW